jgi:hypothetical protein
MNHHPNALEARTEGTDDQRRVPPPAIHVIVFSSTYVSYPLKGDAASLAPDEIASPATGEIAATLQFLFLHAAAHTNQCTKT